MKKFYGTFDATPYGWDRVKHLVKQNMLELWMGLVAVLGTIVAGFVWFIKKY